MFGHQDHLIEERYIPSYDPDTAKTLFQTVNWTGEILIGFNYGGDVRKQAALLLANSINDMDIGITINAMEMDWPTYLRAVRARKLPVFWLGRAPDYADPDSYVSPFYYHLNTYAQRLNYNNTGVNSRILAAASEQNVTERGILYKEIEEMAAKDTAFIYGYQLQTYSVWRTWITGEKGFDALLQNPMNRRYGIQWLEKMVETTTTTTTTTTMTTTSTTTTTLLGLGFEFISLVGVASLLLIYKKQKR
jgi:ABC-type transport system substrate-binding protein